MIELAGDVNRPSVGFDDGLGNRQSHSGSFNHRALLFAAVKLVEDQPLFHGVDSRSAVRYAEGDKISAILRADHNWLVLLRIQTRIFQQLNDDLFGPSYIGSDRWQARRDLKLEVPPGERSLAVCQSGVDQFLHGHRAELQLDLSRLQLGHLRGVFHQFVQAVALLVHDFQQLPTVDALRGTWRKKRCYRRFDGSERRTKIVGDGVQQRGFKPLALPVGFGPAELLDCASPLNGNSQERSHRVQSLPGQRSSRNSKASYRFHADAHRPKTKSTRGIDKRLFTLVSNTQLLLFELQSPETRAVKFLLVRQEHAGRAAFKCIHNVIGNRV